MMIAGCTSENKDINPYAGTMWSKSYHSTFTDEDYMHVIEFSDTDFSYYEADINGGYKSGMTQGTYTYSGDIITINNVRMNTSILDEYITGATVSGNMLTLHSYWESDSGERYESDEIMNKRR